MITVPGVGCREGREVGCWGSGYRYLRIFWYMYGHLIVHIINNDITALIRTLTWVPNISIPTLDIAHVDTDLFRIAYHFRGTDPDREVEVESSIRCFLSDEAGAGLVWANKSADTILEGSMRRNSQVTESSVLYVTLQ